MRAQSARSEVTLDPEDVRRLALLAAALRVISIVNHLRLHEQSLTVTRAEQPPLEIEFIGRVACLRFHRRQRSLLSCACGASIPDRTRDGFGTGYARLGRTDGDALSAHVPADDAAVRPAASIRRAVAGNGRRFRNSCARINRQHADVQQRYRAQSPSCRQTPTFSCGAAWSRPKIRPVSEVEVGDCRIWPARLCGVPGEEHSRGEVAPHLSPTTAPTSTTRSFHEQPEL